jgi:hypothetical protein
VRWGVLVTMFGVALSAIGGLRLRDEAREPG